jgi:hypothetical protein
MTTMTTSSPTTKTTWTGGRWRRLALHYLEMLAAMGVGMAVFGLARAAVGVTVEFHDRPGVSFLLMATDMALGMAVWMRVRGHGWPMTLQMCAAMYVPLLLLPLVVAGLMGAMTFMVVAHVVMCMSMLVVLVQPGRR